MSIAHAARPFRRLLDYVPDDVILEAASREFDMHEGTRCVAGWVLRGVLARVVDKTAERVDLGYLGVGTPTLKFGSPRFEEYFSVPEMLATVVGGRERTWEKLFSGVTHEEGTTRYDGIPYAVTLPMIEYAFIRRLAEAVERTRGR